MAKQQILDNLDEVKNYVQEIEQDKIKGKKTIGISIKNRFTRNIIFQSTKTTFKEAIIEKNNADLRDANLRGADLSGANLRDVDLSGANLRGADLSGVELNCADLSGANLSDVDLSDADLSDAELSGADLSGADLSGANLCGAKFYGKGGRKELKKNQVESFLLALGFIIVE